MFSSRLSELFRLSATCTTQPSTFPSSTGPRLSFSMADRTKELFYCAHSQHFYSWLMRMPWEQGSDSSLGVLLLHPHTLVMWSAEEESCHQSVPGPSEQGRSTGGSSGWPTFSLSQHLKVSSRSATAEADRNTKTSLVKGRHCLGTKLVYSWHWLTQWSLFSQNLGGNSILIQNRTV